MIAGVCPECGTARALPEFLADAAARAALAAALACPAELARLVVPYLNLHAPAGRRLRMAKLARLLEELAARFGAGTVTRGRETVAAPPAAWQRGLEEVLAAREAGTLTLPLAGHGYLDDVVFRQQAQLAAHGRASAAPLHPSHRPGLAPEAPRATAAAERQELIRHRRSLQRLFETAAGPMAGALRAQLAAVDAQLRTLGVQLPTPPAAEEVENAVRGD
jgi:hypothetical protein